MDEYLILFSVILILNGLTYAATFDDSSKCDYRNQTLDCSHRGLKLIPKVLPWDAVFIYLDGNQIEVITERSFSGMEHLEVLILSNNKISKIQNGSFHSLPKLRTLNLATNALSSQCIENMAFYNLPALEELKVHENKFWMENLIFPLHDMEKFENLKSVSFDGFQTFRFSDLHSVNKHVRDIEIELTYSRSFILTNDTFSHNSSHQIKTLVTDINDIETGALCHFSNMERLRLENRVSLNTRPLIDKIFKSLQCLKGRNISSLEIAGNIEAYSFTMGKLHFSSISGICIKHLSAVGDFMVQIDYVALEKYSVQSAARCLEEINFNSNPIDIDSPWYINLARLPNIRVMSFYHPYKKPTGIKDECMQAQFGPDNSYIDEIPIPPSLEKFSFRNFDLNPFVFQTTNLKGGSNMRVLDLSDTAMCSGGSGIMIRGLPNLRHLTLSGWFFKVVNESFLVQFPKLEIFVCKNCYLGIGLSKNSKIHTFFHNLSSLHTVDFFGNEINNLREDIFDPLKSTVKNLNLGKNNFTDFPLQPHLFANLSFLDLSRNQFKNIDKKYLDSIVKTKNVSVYLSKNPFLCVCASLPLLRVLNRSNIADYDQIECSTEDGNVLLLADFAKNIKAFEEHCIGKVWIIMGMVILSTFLVGLFLGAVWYKYRTWLKYYVTYIRIKGEDAIDDDTCLFDAFLSYCHNDWEQGVSQTFHKLTNNGVRICVDDIHFRPGLPIEENIIKAIDDSRKVMFAVTENFLRSHWGTLEVEFVRYHVCNNKGKKKIFLLLEEGIDIERLPVALKNIWRRITCIRWPKNMTEEQENRWYRKLVQRLKTKN